MTGLPLPPGRHSLTLDLDVSDTGHVTARVKKFGATLATIEGTADEVRAGAIAFAQHASLTPALSP